MGIRFVFDVYANEQKLKKCLTAIDEYFRSGDNLVLRPCAVHSEEQTGTNIMPAIDEGIRDTGLKTTARNARLP